MRPWTLVAWMFLTLGIVIGSWWAYYVLGWGGWWFWDPVENASFMPWLLGCALIHSLAVVEKRHTFKRWSLLLAIATFSLCLLGTFLVRSGVLTSVHAFANDPQRGLYILIFLTLVMGCALILFMVRAPLMKSPAGFDGLSRESFLLINNALLVLACATVFLGTLYPLFLEILTGNKISVGPPYFSSVFVPLMMILFIFMGFAPASKFRETKGRDLLTHIAVPAVLALALAAMVGMFMPIGVMITVALGSWIILSLLENIYSKFKTITASDWGMYCAHFGAAMLLLGVGLSKQLEVEKDVYMNLGDTAYAGPYEFVLTALNPAVGPNYTMTVASIKAYKNDKLITVLHPEKRIYNVRKIAQSQTDIDPGFTRDLYVALGEQLGDTQWSVRIYYKPFIRWIWLGGLLIALGALWAVFDKRYRIKENQNV
jgi:cytochrome c-type biogenesis protein CcmF